MTDVEAMAERIGWKIARRDRAKVRKGRIRIQGAPFTFRTLHPPDRRALSYGENRPGMSLDAEITVTLPAVAGATWKPKPTMTVELPWAEDIGD